jgi:hypothetical protein
MLTVIELCKPLADIKLASDPQVSTQSSPALPSVLGITGPTCLTISPSAAASQFNHTTSTMAGFLCVPFEVRGH